MFNIPFSVMNYHQSESLVNKRQHRENWARPIKNPPYPLIYHFLYLKNVRIHSTSQIIDSLVYIEGRNYMTKKRTTELLSSALS